MAYELPESEITKILREIKESNGIKGYRYAGNGTCSCGKFIAVGLHVSGGDQEAAIDGLKAMENEE
jgi:hypothetical protein